jgi:hypothetical protein
MRHLAPDVVKPVSQRYLKSPQVPGFLKDENDFTLYINGEYKESFFLSLIDPFRVRRVLIWGRPWIYVHSLPWDLESSYIKPMDTFPMGMPLREGRYVISIETK